MSTNYERAQSLLATEQGSTEGRALAYAVLALADAVEAAEFPTLDIKKCLGGLGWSVRPSRSARIGRAS